LAKLQHQLGKYRFVSCALRAPRFANVAICYPQVQWYISIPATNQVNDELFEIWSVVAGVTLSDVNGFRDGFPLKGRLN